jgi:hypothetical protein
MPKTAYNICQLVRRRRPVRTEVSQVARVEQGGANSCESASRISFELLNDLFKAETRNESAHLKSWSLKNDYKRLLSN